MMVLQVAGCKQALLSTLLVRQLESKKCKVNIDPQIFSILQETKYMTHMGLEIPPIARTLYLHKGKFKSVTEKLQVFSY